MNFYPYKRKLSTLLFITWIHCKNEFIIAYNQIACINIPVYFFFQIIYRNIIFHIQMCMKFDNLSNNVG